MERLVEWCDDCGRIVSERFGACGKWLPSNRLPPGVALASLPLVGDQAVWRTCEACWQPAYCELHHYAPRGAFSAEESERHPVRWLCRPCHEYWHARIGQPIKVKWQHEHGPAVRRQRIPPTTGGRE